MGAKPPAPRPAGRYPPAARWGQAGLSPQARKTKLKKEEKTKHGKNKPKKHLGNGLRLVTDSVCAPATFSVVVLSNSTGLQKEDLG